MTTRAVAAPVLTGERVRLRPARPDDAPHFRRWADDARFSWLQWGRRNGRFPDDAAVRDWLERFRARDGLMFVIEHLPKEGGSAPFHHQEGRPIGFADHRDWRPKPRSAEIGIGIGEPALWGRGLGRDALGALMRHLVDDLGAHRVTLSVLAFNDRAIAMYKRCGFEVEGIGRDAVLTDEGTFVDDVRMAYVAGRAPPRFDPRPIVLEGRHVRLEPLRLEHAPAFFEAVREPDIWTWLGSAPPRTVADMERYIREALDLQIRGEHLPWATVRASDGRVVGSTRFGAIDRANRSVEIGWTMLGAEGRRTAANTEANRARVARGTPAFGASACPERYGSA